MSDLHDLAAPYALNALDDLERARFEAHLDSCPDCRDEVASLTEGAFHLGTATAPPPAMRDRILHEVTRIQQEGPASEPSARTSRSPWWWAASIAAGFLVIFGTFTLLTSDASPSLSDIQAAADAREISLEGSAATTARFVYSVEEGRGFFVATGLATVGADQTYELWLIDGQTPIPAGLFVPAEGLASVAVDGDLGSAAAIALTIEPEGGSEVPTGEILLVGALQ